MVNEIPIPSKRFNNGPPKQAENPIRGYPCFAVAVSATKSPIELPQARAVSPKTASDKFRDTPKAFKRPTISFGMTYIHTIEIANPRRENVSRKYFGFFNGIEVHKITMDPSRDKSSPSCQNDIDSYITMELRLVQ